MAWKKHIASLPSRVCPNGGKRSYVSKDAALRRRDMGYRSKGRIRAYLCPYCDYWHLTHLR